MSHQHQKWVGLVELQLSIKNWSKSDLAQVCGVTPVMITRLINEGHGSDELKLRVSRKLGIREPWEEF